MAIKVKPVASSTVKWAERAAGAAEEYGVEAQASADSWASLTQAAKDNFRLAIAQPGMADRFAGGVRRAGAAKYARKIRDVAVMRFAPGVEAGKEDYAQRVEPFFSTIAGLSLAARKPRGDPANYGRGEQVGKALHARRLALLGMGG